MNCERNILKRLLEGNIETDDNVEDSQDLDEKTYTVGSTQYWRRSGKCYSWTQEGGRKECSEDEYLKAISGTTNSKAGDVVSKGSETQTPSKREPSTKTKTSRPSAESKMKTFSDSLKPHEKEAFDYMVGSMNPDLKKYFAKYSQKSEFQDGPKYEYLGGQANSGEDSDKFNFYIPKASFGSMNKELYSTFGSGKPSRGGSSQVYRIPSTDSSGDFEIELGMGKGGCSLSIKKSY